MAFTATHTHIAYAWEYHGCVCSPINITKRESSFPVTHLAFRDPNTKSIHSHVSLSSRFVHLRNELVRIKQCANRVRSLHR